ncbi:hypothetical protein HPY28_05565 [Brevibacillus sp. HB1.2]|uniref:hypothetical protein n=1 Tax=Brevibacillus TaxID=55080 RepID=UPI0011B25382|nr:MULTISPECIES: hypothetical protein [Brevibacillus]MED1798400.1 hypothetical protein [Brevibacillus porteri]MED2129311.1 hypothetical protein [Brevibacillus porteri]MED2748560.1 hypothetical protein [Brevibacillus porteri]MED2816967.1 hypothetical protein [Brevibacillus porteri]MED2896072.1 hypothetical protein [Brevibacillus porteri]
MSKDKIVKQLQKEFQSHRFLDCFGCSNSMSGDDKHGEQVLVCAYHKKVVEEDELCESYN